MTSCHGHTEALHRPSQLALNLELHHSLVMASSTGTTMAASPKGGGEGEPSSTSPAPSPKGTGTGGRCLCSPTTHQGSFRCRNHRHLSSGWLRRSNSMPTSPKSTLPAAQKSMDSM